jgi:acyl carrier protein
LIEFDLKNFKMENISKKVTEILVDKLGIADSEVTPDANFIKDLGIDSLDYAEIVMEFEQTFDIRIPDTDAEQLQTMKQAVNYISLQLDKKSTQVG